MSEQFQTIPTLSPGPSSAATPPQPPPASADEAEFQSFAEAIHDELRASGIPETERPFSLESYRRSVAAIMITLLSGDDEFDKAVTAVRKIVQRGRQLMGL